MKTIRKIKFLGICLALVFQSISLHAQSVFDYEGITYRVITDADEASTFGTVAVTMKSDGSYEGAITIPNVVRQSDEAFVDTYKVVAIDDYAFKGSPNLEEVRLPEGVESIGNEAFSICPRLRHIVIPNGNLTHIGTKAFASSGLESITIPNGVKEIPLWAFYECRHLKHVVLPETLKKINVFAFMYCQSLKSIELPQGLTEIGADAFLASGLKRIVLPEKVTSIPQTCFALCIDLEEVQLSPSISEIEMAAFIHCFHLSKINLPENLKTVGEHAFDGCVNIPDYDRYSDVYNDYSVEMLEQMYHNMKGQIWK